VGRYGGAYATQSRTRPGLPWVGKQEYFVMDLYLRYVLREGLTLMLSGKNLLNAAWQQTLDVPEPGLEGRLGMELSI
jgi:outer membrane receptor protein involved in Fe transport